MNDECKHDGRRTATTTVGSEIRRMEWCQDCCALLSDSSCPLPLPGQPMKWTLDEGLALVRKHQSAAFEHGYNLSLGGGVLNRGESEHDLDIVCAPANGTKSTTIITYMLFVEWLRRINGPSLDSGSASPETGGWWNFTMRKFAFSDEHGRKIDWFVVYDATQCQFREDTKRPAPTWQTQETWVGGEGGDV